MGPIIWQLGVSFSALCRPIPFIQWRKSSFKKETIWTNISHASLSSAIEVNKGGDNNTFSWSTDTQTDQEIASKILGDFDPSKKQVWKKYRMFSIVAFPITNSNSILFSKYLSSGWVWFGIFKNGDLTSCHRILYSFLFFFSFLISPWKTKYRKACRILILTFYLIIKFKIEVHRNFISIRKPFPMKEKD